MLTRQSATFSQRQFQTCSKKVVHFSSTWVGQFAQICLVETWPAFDLKQGQLTCLSLLKLAWESKLSVTIIHAMAWLHSERCVDEIRDSPKVLLRFSLGASIANIEYSAPELKRRPDLLWLEAANKAQTEMIRLWSVVYTQQGFTFYLLLCDFWDTSP